MSAISPEHKRHSTRQFALILAGVFALLAALPALFAVLTAPAESSYIGSVYNTDDHMVYAAWMRQAMDGHLLFDNRFAVDPQPGLTIHLYFFLVGVLASLTGIAFAANVARIALSFAFVWLLYRLIRKLDWDLYAVKLAIVLPVIAGGVGFLAWQTFGQAFVKDSFLAAPLLGRLPIDVWQPEAFVFPSMLSNGLFMAALCLILGVFLSVIKARENIRHVWVGAGCMFLLMNIHSYDVLLVTLVLIGFAVAVGARKQLSFSWLGRAIVIGLGAIPPALWFVYVIKNDPVFQARAATETYSPNFRPVLFGILLPLLLGICGLALRPTDDQVVRNRRFAGTALFVIILTALFFAAGQHTSGYFVSMPVWVLLYAATLMATWLLADESPTMNLFIAWALTGVVAIYFPALFQRKLAMGLVLPWGVLAAYGVAYLLKDQDRNARKLVATLVIILFGATSVRWAFREVHLASANVSNTTMHPVYLSNNVNRILDYLNKLKGRRIVVAMPGVQSPVFAANQQEVAALNQLAPIVPDLNPIGSGLAGVYTYAGHWSETPDYNRRRGVLTRLFLAGNSDDSQVTQNLRKLGATYVIAPTQESLPQIPLYDFSRIGDVVVDGSQFRLIRLKE